MVDGFDILEIVELLDQMEHLTRGVFILDRHEDIGNVGQLGGFRLDLLIAERLGDGIILAHGAHHFEVVALILDIFGARFEDDVHQGLFIALLRIDDKLPFPVSIQEWFSKALILQELLKRTLKNY